MVNKDPRMILGGGVKISGILICAWFVVAVGLHAQGQQEATKNEGSARQEISFSADVFPIIKKNCLPCHAEENFNPSELSLDSYKLLMAGGKHGESVVPGRSSESNLVKKLLPEPPFGDRMPLDLKKKKGRKSTKAIPEEEIQVIATWIDQGARDN
jgi:hypothetical protein